MDTEEFRGDEFAAPDTQSAPVHAPAAPPPYHTTNQLQALVAQATGKPCKSRNRPALLKKLGMPAEAADWRKNPVLKADDGPCVVEKITAKRVATNRAKTGKPGAIVDAGGPGDYDKINKALRAVTAPANVERIVSRRVNGKRTGKSKPSKDKGRPKVAQFLRDGAPVTKPNHHAIALAYVRKAMARKNPPSLFNLMCEMNERRIKTPTGDEWRWKSSVQSLMRQAVRK